MTIAKRMLVLILVAVFGVVGIGLWGLRQAKVIDENLEYITTNSLPSLGVAAAVESEFLRMRTRIMYHLAHNDPAQKQADEKLIQDHRQKMETLMHEYEGLVSNDEDARLLANSKRLIGEYNKLVDHALELSRENKVDQAKDYLFGNGKQISDDTVSNITNHYQFNENLAKEQGKNAAATYESSVVVSIVVTVFVTLFTAGFGFWVYQHVAGSLARMVEAFEAVMAHLDFTRRIEVRHDDEVGKAVVAFNALVEKLQGSFRQIADRTAAVNSAANRVATASKEMSTASSYQSEAASSMAATVEEMTVSINHVADRAGEANRLSSSSGELAVGGQAIIGQTVEGINGIAETVHQAAEQIARLETDSERINAVVAVIKDVADQTNLLALNAAIEAARAGEQGRGFAVVADEVRKLAERTTKSTQEIAATITEMQTGSQNAVQGIQAVVGRVEDGVAKAEKANQAIQEIGGSSQQTVAMVGDISDAIREQSVASTSIAQQVEKIAQMSEENSAAAQSTADTASELATLAAEMQQVVSQYRI
ncbi:methyl-accepting chemotaxis protein [Azospira inquinata]|uniref:Methyl-accepting chemotaxis protein n=1 Tax=Azospira inquinata TaxID=2785627 RepID=A0A975SPA1_9RHOO|nr:HAMP domain-containing methyl-accepting chemotaxis protein [Azospira inquinata]QWT47326.1 methyl-accepting chemotaxis protein [Azospira inquinata]QWT50049.1 methyl-accepting chemotaxis protein [Azospira inquinata]